MKTDKEFINGIYEKYEEHKNDKKQKNKFYMKKITSIAAVFVIIFSSLILLTGCSIQENPISENGKVEETKIKLKMLGSFENFYNIIKENYGSVNGEESDRGGVLEQLEDTKDSVTNSIEQNSSETNTQVDNVDEADIVKVADNYIYYIAENKVVIIKAENPESAEKVAEIDYSNETFRPIEMFVNKNHLVVIGSMSEEITVINSIEDTDTKDYAMTPEYKCGMILYDVSDKQSPKETRRIEIEGGYLSSRMIEDSIYLVANKYLYCSELIKNGIEGVNENDYQLHYRDTSISQEEKIIDYNKIYYFDKMESSNYLTMVGINLNSNDEADLQTFLGAGNIVYASENNMYLAKTNIEYGENFKIQSSNTQILKFKLNNGKIEFQVEGVVDGIVNNQFSMDENGEFFRIATTIGDVYNLDETTSNTLYVLNEKLEVVGKVANFAKEEKIYSVRYIGDKAYVVTFKQTDPFFVIDLSTPTNPQIIGELKLPGYSTYLHPYDETHIIGIGYDTKEDGTRITNNGMKMVMFDISDFSNPQVLFKTDIGEKNTTSEITYNHKSIVYSKEKNIIAFPLLDYGIKQSNSRAAIYEIDLEKGFILKGEITHLTNNYLENVERVVFVNNAYYTLSKKLIKAANMETLEVIKEMDI